MENCDFGRYKSLKLYYGDLVYSDGRLQEFYVVDSDFLEAKKIVEKKISGRDDVRINSLELKLEISVDTMNDSGIPQLVIGSPDKVFEIIQILLGIGNDGRGNIEIPDFYDGVD
ncbi:MAG: hypothetical protein ABIF88_01025 [archaeon]